VLMSDTQKKLQSGADRTGMSYYRCYIFGENQNAESIGCSRTMLLRKRNSGLFSSPEFRECYNWTAILKGGKKFNGYASFHLKPAADRYKYGTACVLFLQ